MVKHYFTEFSGDWLIHVDARGLIVANFSDFSSLWAHTCVHTGTVLCGLTCVYIKELCSVEKEEGYCMSKNQTDGQTA